MAKEKAPVRRSRRFAISRRGTLGYGDLRFACLIHDVSDEGLLLLCNFDFEIGTELDVHFELEPGARISGRVRVKHCSDGCLGTVLLKMNRESGKNWKQFLEGHYAGQLGLNERRWRM